ncbi:MAG TPA: DUF29 domain-containing protein [Candidatus Limnocylindrales bacterium]|nr:DUF29 domain-containing protein [Candidatus Limnocylindrales bacterium]
MEKIVKDYEKDFYAWLMKNAELIRQGKFSEVDTENVAEELEAMGRSEKQELMNRLTLLLVYLLKWQFQPVRRSKSGKNTIITQRLDIQELLNESPSLRQELEQGIEIAYQKAKLKAEDETGIDLRHFPIKCPFSFEQILDDNFFPEQE